MRGEAKDETTRVKARVRVRGIFERYAPYRSTSVLLNRHIVCLVVFSMLNTTTHHTTPHWAASHHVTSRRVAPRHRVGVDQNQAAAH